VCSIEVVLVEVGIEVVAESRVAGHERAGERGSPALDEPARAAAQGNQAANEGGRNLPDAGLADAQGRDTARGQDDGWQVSDRRYFSLGSMMKVNALEGGEDPKELLAQIA
jgi:hypothetical protein